VRSLPELLLVGAQREYVLRKQFSSGIGRPVSVRYGGV